ncbi:hypothetical protein CANARDRAFT_84752 [[Candida] arabinofermentans NRRL YB-2248]|uniref:Uncharacterized protein n=1 Tax=[Candida] arabinofermentans NRRL YB-2248 TaxID=983967 RepID=A0A1E4T5L1_9ASCO|nr:hypothetical protein CANARDRAFT_84752 [[Candida] arabinofermentans NRRL YB-2248]
MAGFDIDRVPGGFPSLQDIQLNQTCHDSLITSTPPKQQNAQNRSTPSSSFKFTPTNGRRLYPSLKSPCSISHSQQDEADYDMSYQDKENTSFVHEMDHLEQRLFSQKLTTSVLSEYNDRYEKVRLEKLMDIQKMNNTTTNQDLNRRASGRFTSSHKNKFNRMESISSHYAARRAQTKKLERSPAHRNLADKSIYQPNIDQSKTPGEKRGTLMNPGSSQKRMKTTDGSFKEIYSDVANESPTRPQLEKQKIKEQQLQKLKLQQSQTLAPPPSFELTSHRIPTLVRKDSKPALNDQSSIKKDTRLSSDHSLQTKNSTKLSLASQVSLTQGRDSRPATKSVVQQTRLPSSSTTTLPKSTPTQPRFPSYALPTRSSIKKSESVLKEMNAPISQKKIIRSKTMQEISPSRTSALASSSSSLSNRNASTNHYPNQPSLYPKLQSTTPHLTNSALSAAQSSKLPTSEPTKQYGSMSRSFTASNLPRLVRPSQSSTSLRQSSISSTTSFSSSDRSQARPWR